MTQYTELDLDAAFARFRAAYPRRKGSNPWHVARKSFDRAVKDGAAPETIIAGVLLYYAEQRDLNQINTPFVCQAATWLNQRRWADYIETDQVAAVRPVTWVLRDCPLWDKAAIKWLREKGRFPPSVGGKNGMGWYFPAEWVGGAT